MKHRLDDRLDAIGWGLFFVWVGVALFSDLSTGVGLLGVGVITLGMQAVRKYFGLALESFWLVIGVLFTLGGIWGLYNVNISLAPLILVAVGLFLLLSALKRKK